MDKVKLIGRAAKDPNNVLIECVDTLKDVVIIGHDKSGDLGVSASTNISNEKINFMLDRAKSVILNCDDDLFEGSESLNDLEKNEGATKDYGQNENVVSIFSAEDRHAFNFYDSPGGMGIKLKSNELMVEPDYEKGVSVLVVQTRAGGFLVSREHLAEFAHALSVFIDSEGRYALKDGVKMPCLNYPEEK